MLKSSKVQLDENDFVRVWPKLDCPMRWTRKSFKSSPHFKIPPKLGWYDDSEFGHFRICDNVRISRRSSFTLTVHFRIDPKIKPQDIFSLWRSRGRFLLYHSGAIKTVENDISRCLYDRNLVCWSAPEVKTTSAPFTFSIWKCSKPLFNFIIYFASAKVKNVGQTPKK